MSIYLLYIYVYIYIYCHFGFDKLGPTNSAFSSGILFSIFSALFQDFLSNQTHTSLSDSWKHKVPQ